MKDQEQEVSIVAADHVDGGAIIYFSDGSAALFRQDFLYRYRNLEGNGPVAESEDRER